MSAAERPTAAEKADAADRFIDALDRAHVALIEASTIMRERQPAGSWNSYPLFSFIGDGLKSHIEKAREALWAAHRIAAVQGYEEHRRAKKED